ncbi:cyclase family protein [Nocardioides acrostichi]|uniref:Cyclase family protein n=1 Tax=Nocardioides acrostichi TaxID=2784339 RepID=A0A930UZ95_9ACTN|nr:cyclase family protein [Nocardioides acrostichi]MBF4160770.1 cyclase family protein [Nocardioides acrostichi]
MSTAWDENRRGSLPGVRYVDEEFGRVASVTTEQVAAALSLGSGGRIYDLDSGRWPGMPLFGGHPDFQVLRYRTARGQDLMGDMDEWRGRNEVHMGFTTELVSGTMHTGTHLDALCHTTCGPEDHWYGGFTSGEELTDFGPRRAEASSIAPIITRGILVDATRGNGPLPAGHVITLAEFLEALGDTVVSAGDAVLVNTGYLSLWAGPADVVARHKGAGISVEVADHLADLGVVLVGSDTETVEADPSPDPANPHPVHIRLMIERGVHLLELAWLGDLARDGVTEFLFVCLPLRVRGATGSMVRPVAVV